MEQYIHITKEVRQHLRKVFKVTDVMIWKALNFESDSVLACKIRKAAYENYGILMVKSPAIETLFDHDDYMRQYLPNDVLLEFNKNNGSGDIFLHGKHVKHYENLLWSDIKVVQDYAMTLR